MSLLVSERDNLVVVSDSGQGPPGSVGVKGDKGDTGAPGLAGVSFNFVQSIPAAEWVIQHNLNRFPSVTVVDSAGSVVEGIEEYVSADEIRLSFAAAFAGNAYLN